MVSARPRAGGEGGTLSPALTRMVGLVGAMVSFEEGAALLQELAGAAVPTKQVERVAEALGAALAEDERQAVAPPDAAVPSAPTLYLGLDGTGVPMRPEEVAGRAGQQPDGSAKTRAATLWTVGSAEGHDAEGVPVRDEGSVPSSAAIESVAQRDAEATPSAFAARVARETSRRGFDRAARRVALGEGALWLWNLASAQYPDAIQIVDRFHAKPHLSEGGKAVYGPTSDLARTWARPRHDELDAGAGDAMLDALRTHAATHEAARKGVD